MVCYLSSYKNNPIKEYFFARITKEKNNVVSILSADLNAAYIDEKNHTVTFFPFESVYEISEHEQKNWFTLAENDALAIENTGVCRRFYCAEEDDATVLTGLACNTNCLMCPVSEGARLDAPTVQTDELLEQISYFGSALPHVTITGGEPTMLGVGLIDVINKLHNHCPGVSVLLLSNGRAFSVQQYAQIINQAMKSQDQVAIPIHGSTAMAHDSITQVNGSFVQTIKGLNHLSAGKMHIEIRVVVSKLNSKDITNIAEFLCSKIQRISVVNFIGLEMCGNAAKNKSVVGISYSEAAQSCEQAIPLLGEHGIDVGLYNFPLCTVNHSLWPLCKDSITDYKIRYAPECERCIVRSICFGVFDSTLNSGIFKAKPILE